MKCVRRHEFQSALHTGSRTLLDQISWKDHERDSELLSRVRNILQNQRQVYVLCLASLLRERPHQRFTDGVINFELEQKPELHVDLADMLLRILHHTRARNLMLHIRQETLLDHQRDFTQVAELIECDFIDDLEIIALYILVQGISNGIEEVSLSTLLIPASTAGKDIQRGRAQIAL